MINNQYQLYQQSVLALAETIVIKFEGAADALNNQVMRDHGLDAFDEFDPHSWKYFQNIAGQYHSTDTPIYINSLDVNEQILFSKENLQIHRATRAAYAFGSRYYEELLLQHPEQEMLIRGILYPADIDKAIDAKDGTILAYPTHLIEPWEYSLRKRLQDWIYGYLNRYVVRGFEMTDDLYCAAYMGQLYLHLIQAVFVFRKEACMTSEVHTFHLQQYLASHGYLDKFLPYLLRDQALFLYRNLNYLRRFAGKRDTFDWLVEKILTRRGFPLYAYEMNHNVSQMARPNLLSDSTMLPEVKFRRRARSPLAKQNEALDYSLEYVLAKVANLAPGNPEYHTYEKEAMRDGFSHSKSAVVKTKSLESAVTDYSGAVAYPLEKVVFNHWLAWAATGKYRANVILNIEGVGLGIRLDAAQALTLYLYCLTQALGKGIDGLPEDQRPIDRIPLISSSRVIRSPVPTLGSLRNKVPKDYVTDAKIQQIVDTGVASPFSIISVDTFYDTCLEIYAASNLQYKLYSSQEHYMARGYMQSLASWMHEDRVDPIVNTRDPQDPTQGMLFTDWLSEMRLDFSAFTPTQFYELSAQILAQATGMATRTPTSIGLIQEMMVKLFLTLSSYSIQVTLDASLQNVLVSPRPDIRIGDIPQREKTHHFIDVAPVRIIGLLTKVKQRWGLNLQGSILDQAPRSKEKGRWDINTGLLLLYPNIARETRYLDTSLQYRYSESFSQLAQDMSPMEYSYLFDEYGYNPDERSGFVNQTNLGRFVYVGGTKVVVPSKTVYETYHLPPFNLTFGTKTLPGYHFSGKRKQLDGFKWLTTKTQISGWRWYHASKQLNGFTWAQGTTVIAPFVLTMGDKELGAWRYVGGKKQIRIEHSRQVKQLDGFRWSQERKRLSGWQFLSKSGDTDV